MRIAAPGLLVLLCLSWSFQAPAEDQPSGSSIFRANCAFCHGINGRGGRGPSLVSARVAANTSDAALQSIVKGGIPGTGMPAFDLEKDEMAALIRHVRSLAGAGARVEEVSGNPARGHDVYASSGCEGCHRIGNAGSVYGPELTRIGAARSADYLRESIVNPSADIAPEYEGVAVVAKDGKRFAGVRINEDTFTVQLRLPNQNFALFDKSEVKSVEPLRESLMPAYQALPPSQLTDLVAYLATLRGQSGGGDVNKLQGIH